MKNTLKNNYNHTFKMILDHEKIYVCVINKDEKLKKKKTKQENSGNIKMSMNSKKFIVWKTFSIPRLIL